VLEAEDLVCAGKLFNTSKVHDETFKRFVRDFMRREMPGLTLDLLDTEISERWEIVPEERYRVEEIDVDAFECSECRSVVFSREEECCLDDEKKPVPFIATVFEGYALRDMEYGNLVTDDHSYHLYSWDHEAPQKDGTTVLIWETESAADDSARTLDQETQHESSYGFPWANNFFYMPCTFISTDVLTRAGFRVAYYTGGNGDPRESQTFRICGVDGGGYDFFTHHHCRLVALLFEEKGWEVATDNGSKKITTATDLVAHLSREVQA